MRAANNRSQRTASPPLLRGVGRNEMRTGLTLIVAMFLSGCGTIRPVRVADSTGKPIAGAMVLMTELNKLNLHHDQIIGQTDSNGLFSARMVGLVIVHVGKEGYWPTNVWHSSNYSVEDLSIKLLTTSVTPPKDLKRYLYYHFRDKDLRDNESLRNRWVNYFKATEHIGEAANK